MIDVDCQQPEFFKPECLKTEEEQKIQETGEIPLHTTNIVETGHTSRELREAEEEAEEWDSMVVRALTAWAGSPFSTKEELHIDKARRLKESYTTIDHARTLDQSFHEHLEEDELNRRNGDQVVSRYIARTYLKHSKAYQRNGETPQDQAESDEDPLLVSPMLSRADLQESHQHQRYGSFNHLSRRLTNYRNLDDGEQSQEQLHIRQQVLVVPSLRVWKFESMALRPQLI